MAICTCVRTNDFAGKVWEMVSTSASSNPHTSKLFRQIWTQGTHYSNVRRKKNNPEMNRTSVLVNEQQHQCLKKGISWSEMCSQITNKFHKWTNSDFVQIPLLGDLLRPMIIETKSRRSNSSICRMLALDASTPVSHLVSIVWYSVWDIRLNYTLTHFSMCGLVL